MGQCANSSFRQTWVITHGLSGSGQGRVLAEESACSDVISRR
jgi:hypothetical protein